MEMKDSLIIHVCGVLCSILLVLPSAKCLSLQKLEKRDIPGDSAGVDGGNISQYIAEDLLSAQSTTEKEIYNTTSFVTSPNSVVAEESHNSTHLLSNSTVTDIIPETNTPGLDIKASPTGQGNASSETGILTTAGSTVLYISSGSPVSEATKGGPQESYQPAINHNTGLQESTTSSHLDDQPLTSVTVEAMPISEMPINPITTTLGDTNNTVDVTIPQTTEDWDDTKVTAKKVGGIDDASPVPDQFMVTENSNTLLPTSDDILVSSATKYTHVTVPDVSHSTKLPDIVIEMTQSQELSPVYTASVKEQLPQTSESSNVTEAAPILNVTSNEMKKDSVETGNTEGIELDSITIKTNSSNETSTRHPNTDQFLSHEQPTTEGLNLPSGDEFMATSLSLAVPITTTQAEDTTILTTVTSASHVSVIAPPTRRITTTATYRIDKMESEEGEEEDEEEEDEDDEEMEEEDEEEEDDDKDTDSAGDSSDKDSDLPPFTLPGLSSQEPLEDDGNVALIEGAAYQVPDAMEWEQQNQGLVRSWMEKLKDKAGYMSGMLIPVGVGIAGALFILGVLYSIKIMNRRRRNGFKRHKRKQREFNSMQDRVMLLADSSEDEF